MLHEDAASANRREEELAALVDSPATVAPRKDLPSYGAQHRQDALWKGGNGALPPMWQRLQVLDHKTLYQDNNLIMGSWNQPLPGVRLDQPGDLVPGCEWHISPSGRSYFVNHNTQTTSWRKPVPDRQAGSLAPECVIEGHSKCIWDIAYLGSSCSIMSSSSDGSIQRWTKDGKPIGKPWISDGGVVGSIGVSPDETMVVSGSADGRIRLWNIKEGKMVGNLWKGHNDAVICLNWSPDAMEIASGSYDGTIRRWNPDTGRQIAPLIQTSHGWVCAVKYSPQGDKFASAGSDKIIRLWSKKGELLIEIKGHENAVTSLYWSKDGTRIFSASLDCTIRTWQSSDGKELVVLRGHTKAVTSLCLSPDESHLISASRDCSVRIWDLKTNQPVGEPLLHDGELLALAMSTDGNYVVGAQLYAKICVWSLEAALKQQGGDQIGNLHDSNADAQPKRRAAPIRDPNFDIHVVSKRQANNKGMAKYGNDFFGNVTDHTPSRPAPPTGSSSSQPSRWRNLFGFLRFSSTQPTDVAPQSIPLRRWYLARDDRPTQSTRGQNIATNTEEASCMIGCCGFYLVRRRSTSH
jgi:WD40 repeat protein